MGKYAFTRKAGFVVDQSMYRKHKSYEYETDGIPIVQLPMYKSGSFWTRRIRTLVDTGAFISTLKDSSADKLGISRWPNKNETAKVVGGPGGEPVIGLMRTVSISLGGRTQEIDVLVPSRVDVKERDRIVIGSEPSQNLLGRRGILSHYLLCFDSQRFYVFPRH